MVMKSDHVEIANQKSLEEFVKDYIPPLAQWTTWIHPKSNEEYGISLQKAASLSANDFEACFKLIELTSLEDYRRSKDGWKAKAKRKEMKLLDLKYLVVKDGDQLRGFCSFMPTVEDGYFVIYCYEIHLAPSLQGTGLGNLLMGFLDIVGSKIPDIEKIMLTCFLSNQRALQFYRKLGFETDENSPPPRMLRNGTKFDADYVILSKAVQR